VVFVCYFIEAFMVIYLTSASSCISFVVYMFAQQHISIAVIGMVSRRWID
jgi:hypothetical protein